MPVEYTSRIEKPCSYALSNFLVHVLSTLPTVFQSSASARDGMPALKNLVSNADKSLVIAFSILVTGEKIASKHGITRYLI